jgi:raffinose/stachyose/melibiose transport system permease protein
VLQGLGLFKTMPGLILIEIAYGLPFCILLFSLHYDCATGVR